jgi:urease accessory protein UreH/urease accessory protein UreF
MKQLSRKIQQRLAGGCCGYHHLPGRTRTWNPPLEPIAPADIGGFASLVVCPQSYTRRRRTLTTASAATTTTTDDFLETTTTPHFNEQQEGSSANDSSSSPGASSSSSSCTNHSVPFRYTQQGTATLVAHLDSSSHHHNTNHNNHTTRVQVSHKAPCRWIPIRATTANNSSSPRRRTSTNAPGGPTTTIRPATAATVALGHYGGGMAGGDSAVIDITVTAGAVLHVTSQGTNRVYKSKQQQQHRPLADTNTAVTADVDDDGVTRLETTVRCGPDATCWMIPDPTQLQRNARYRQTIHYELDITSCNCIAIDWVSAGRLTRGERWDFTSCQLRTTVSIITTGDTADAAAAADNTTSKGTTSTPVFVDAQDLRPGFSGMDYAGNVQLHAFGTVILYRPDATILARFRQVQRDLCRPHLAVRNSSAVDEEDDDDDVTSGSSASRTTSSSFPVASVLSGRVILGMSESETTTDLHICRFTAECNEDLFRIFHYCLGQQVYSERIRAVQSAPPVRVVVPVIVDATAPPPKTTTARSAEMSSAIPHFTPPPLSSSASLLSSLKSPSLNPSLGMLTMADSMFPIGSFAHSFGIETAAQLGLFPSSRSSSTQVLHQYLQAVLRSTVQQAIPLIRTPLAFPEQWRATNDHADCLLSSNPPLYRASIEQAKNLQRIRDAMNGGNSNNEETSPLSRIAATSNGVVHLAPLWGLVATTTFGLTEQEAIHAFVYTMARDLVSAAVRMNLLGPMEGQTLLWKELLALSYHDDNDDDDDATTTTARGRRCRRQHYFDPMVPPTLDDASTAAPAVDAIQPCHDLLATRLFRS